MTCVPRKCQIPLTKGFAAENLRLCIKVKTLDFVNRGELMSKLAGPREIPVTHSSGQAYIT